jgi:CRP-like cAMP-binding protein
VLSVLNGDELRMAEQAMDRLGYADDKTVFMQGAPVHGLYILCQGYIKLAFGTQDGRRLLVRFCPPGDLLNGITLPEHAFSAVSLGASTVSLIDKARAMELIKQYPKLELEIEHRFAQDGQHLLQRMADLAYESVGERLAHLLLSLGQRHGVQEGKALRIDFPLSQKDLADMVGASRQMVNQELRKLADQGLIREERCRITVLDEKGLQDLG